jgi:hypothetical protein
MFPPDLIPTRLKTAHQQEASHAGLSGRFIGWSVDSMAEGHNRAFEDSVLIRAPAWGRPHGRYAPFDIGWVSTKIF